MAGFANEVLARMKAVEVEMQSLQKRREELDREQKELEKELEAYRLLLDREARRNGNIASNGSYVAKNGVSKWAGVPLTKAIAMLLDERPDWRNLDRKKMFREVRNQLVADRYDFAGKTPAFAVNIALTKVVNANNMTKKDDDGQPG